MPGTARGMDDGTEDESGSADARPRQKQRRPSGGGSSTAVATGAPTAAGAAAAARQATFAKLVDEGTRAQASLSVLACELGDIDIVCIRTNAELAAEREAAERMRTELRAREEEHERLVARLAAAQRVNEEWQVRVRDVSSDLEARAVEWQAQLIDADTKWRAIGVASGQGLGGEGARRDRHAGVAGVAPRK